MISILMLCPLGLRGQPHLLATWQWCCLTESSRNQSSPLGLRPLGWWQCNSPTNFWAALLVSQSLWEIFFPFPEGEHRFVTQFSSVHFSCSVVSDSLRPHGLQHTRPPCPSSTPRVHPNSCPLSRWCHPTISSSVDPFSSHLQSFPTSGSFQMS